MSKAKYTRPIEIEMTGTQMALRFCDAQVSYWRDELGDLSEWDGEKPPTLRDEIAALIESHASDLAESIVYDLRNRVLS